MSTLQQKVEAMEKVGAGEAADYALHKLMRLHVQRYERQVAAVQRELVPRIQGRATVGFEDWISHMKSAPQNAAEEFDS
jgi:hypothetical protein